MKYIKELEYLYNAEKATNSVNDKHTIILNNLIVTAELMHLFKEKKISLVEDEIQVNNLTSEDSPLFEIIKKEKSIALIHQNFNYEFELFGNDFNQEEYDNHIESLREKIKNNKDVYAALVLSYPLWIGSDKLGQKLVHIENEVSTLLREVNMFNTVNNIRDKVAIYKLSDLVGAKKYLFNNTRWGALGYFKGIKKR